MKVLLDECLPHQIRNHLGSHEVYSTAYMGWAGIRNGRLLALAAGDGFEALLTTDQNIECQQNLATLPIAIVVMHSASNDTDDLLPLIPGLLAAFSTLTRRAVTHVR